MKYSRGARNYISGNKYNVVLKFSSVLLFCPFEFLCHESSVWLKKEVIQWVLQSCHNGVVHVLFIVQPIIPGLKWQLKGPEHKVRE